MLGCFAGIILLLLVGGAAPGQAIAGRARRGPARSRCVRRGARRCWPAPSPSGGGICAASRRPAPRGFNDDDISCTGAQIVYVILRDPLAALESTLNANHFVKSHVLQAVNQALDGRSGPAPSLRRPAPSRSYHGKVHVSSGGRGQPTAASPALDALLRHDGCLPRWDHYHHFDNSSSAAWCECSGQAATGPFCSPFPRGAVRRAARERGPRDAARGEEAAAQAGRRVDPGGDGTRLRAAGVAVGLETQRLRGGEGRGGRSAPSALDSGGGRAAARAQPVGLRAFRVRPACRAQSHAEGRGSHEKSHLPSPLLLRLLLLLLPRPADPPWNPLKSAVSP
ncbi:unnamed protein product [Prorocentrum cordatum]|uniref:Uncharacterized protein n=1 Tax=Prorocentrum cordatum TaxID=2364126 RepID=A0ABN9X604_9DINO|nr:unnamed protein product [Polarella glacialis]